VRDIFNKLGPFKINKVEAQSNSNSTEVEVKKPQKDAKTGDM
jgi:hypothetical protein